MNKLIKAMNVMIANPQKINDACIGEEYENKEIYFGYEKKHVWSIWENKKGEIYLHFYSKKFYSGDLDPIKASKMDWGDSMYYTSYNTTDLKYKEEIETFTELLYIVKQKITGLDNALDDIISSDKNKDPFLGSWKWHDGSIRDVKKSGRIYERNKPEEKTYWEKFNDTYAIIYRTGNSDHVEFAADKNHIKITIRKGNTINYGTGIRIS